MEEIELIKKGIFRSFISANQLYKNVYCKLHKNNVNFFYNKLFVN